MAQASVKAVARAAGMASRKHRRDLCAKRGGSRRSILSQSHECIYSRTKIGSSRTKHVTVTRKKPSHYGKTFFPLTLLIRPLLRIRPDQEAAFLHFLGGEYEH